MKKFQLTLAMGMVALLTALVQLGWATSADPTAKIASRVLAETANGGSTEALIVLSRQADLSPAENLPTKDKLTQMWDSTHTSAH